MNEILEQKHLLLRMPLPWDIYNARGMLILGKGHMILNEKQRDQLLLQGAFVRSLSVGEEYETTPQVAEAFNPFHILDRTYTSLDALLARPHSFLADFGKRVRQLAITIDETVNEGPDACVAWIFLRPFPHYASAHSLHVAILLSLLVQRLGLGLPERTSLLCAALTMNISMYTAQNDFYRQAIPLSDAQRDMVDEHPVASVKLLQACHIGDDLWLRSVLEHHENWEGTGYPLRMVKEEIHPLSHLLYLADIVGAKLTPRRYREPVRPNVALSQVFLNRGKSVDMQYAALLVKQLGIYPPGTFVLLRNGDTGLVTHRTSNAGTPRVVSVINGQGMPYGEPIPREITDSSFKIEESLPASHALKITNLSKIWRYPSD